MSAWLNAYTVSWKTKPQFYVVLYPKLVFMQALIMLFHHYSGQMFIGDGVYGKNDASHVHDTIVILPLL